MVASNASPANQMVNHLVNHLVKCVQPAPSDATKIQILESSEFQSFRQPLITMFKSSINDWKNLGFRESFRFYLSMFLLRRSKNSDTNLRPKKCMKIEEHPIPHIFLVSKLTHSSKNVAQIISYCY